MNHSKRVLVIGATVVALASTGAVAWAAADRGPKVTRADAAAAQLAPPTYQPDSELTFVPVTSCQVVNTRRTHKLVRNHALKPYAVAGSTGFPGQGGHAGGCGVPASATAVALDLLATSPKKAGSMRVSAGDKNPNQTVLAYQKKQQSTGANTSALGGSTAGIKVSNVGGPTGLTIVVTGCYQKPLAGFVSPSGTPYSGSSRMLAGTRTGTGTYEVQFDRNIRYCAAVATPYVSAYYPSASTWFDSTRPDTLRINVWDANGNPADQYVYVEVQC